MIEHFTEMIAGSLRLEEPWYVEGAKFDEEDKSVHVFVSVRENAKFACPKCGGETSRYGYEPHERLWRHADCMFFPTFVHCRRPRIICKRCGIQQINAPFERKSSRYTIYFEGYAMMLMADMPRAAASRALKCDEKSLASILSYWINRANDQRSLADVTKLAIDETSFKRGHRYVTLIVDALKRCVIDVEEGRNKSAVTQFCDKFNKKGGNPANITAVTSDMSKPFTAAIEEHFTEAIHVIDKFHVKQIVLNALNEVRKKEQKDADNKKELFQNRKLFMKSKDTLSDEESANVVLLSKRYPQTGKAYRIVTALDEFYASNTPQEAEKLFTKLCSWMRRCRLKPMKDAAASLLRHKEKILFYFIDRLTNAICEGINSMVQAAKRKARGYHTFDGFSAMIYLVAGKLKLDVPNPFGY